MTLFEELRDTIHKKHNSNFHFDRLNWVAGLWISTLCTLFEQKLKERTTCQHQSDITAHQE